MTAAAARRAPDRTAWARALQWFGRIDDLHTGLPEREAFTRHTNEVLVRNVRMLAAAIAIVMVVWGVIDRFVLSPEQIALTLYYRIAILAAVAAPSLFLRVAALRARPMLVIGPFEALAGALVGRWVGQLGGPETPWYHFTYLLALLSALTPVSFWHRVWHVGLGFACVMAGFLSADPSYARSPFFPVTIALTCFTWTMGVLAGETVFAAYWSAFQNARRLDTLVDELDARVAAQTIELRSFARQLEARGESERTRLAHDLHDELGQELTALRYAVTLARTRTGGSGSRDIEANLSNIEQLLTRAGLTAQRIVAELRPKVLEELGLHAALDWLVARARERFELDVRLSCDPLPESFGHELDLPVFRTVQEALTNVARHAAATAVDVRVRAGAALVVEVSDDGKGVIETAATRGGGMGLLGMRERARALDGTLELLPRKPHGTIVRLTLPLRLVASHPDGVPAHEPALVEAPEREAIA